MATIKMRPGWSRYALGTGAALVALVIPAWLRNPDSSMTLLSQQTVNYNPSGSYSARVERVIDGDTFEIAAAPPVIGPPAIVVQQLLKVRLYGIDAPERNQPGGPQATTFLTRWMGKQNVTVYPMGTDMYGRLIARVVTDRSKDVSLELAYTGNAWWYTSTAPGATDIRDAELTARAGKKALWSAASPIEPWRWRQGVR